MSTVQKLRFLMLAVLLVAASAVWVFADGLRGVVSAHQEGMWVAGMPGRTAALCVANADGTQVGRDALQRINTAFTTKVRTHRDFQPAGLNAAPTLSAAEATTRLAGIDPLIRAGCPSAATLNTNRWGKNLVKTPGFVQTYVFIASQADVSRTAFKHYPRVVGHEYMCTEGQCNSVANAVYITPEELNNPDTLAQALTEGLGLAWGNPASQPANSNMTFDDKSK